MSFACRRFRAGFTPGGDDPHRRECPRCAAYAEALERAAGTRLPLPGALRQRLLAIPGEACEASSPTTVEPLGRGSVGWRAAAGGDEAAPAARERIAPVRQLPLPPELRARLLALPQRSRQPSRRGGPPAWMLAPRYAVAASYIAALLLGAALGGPGDLGQLVARGVEQTLAVADVAGSAGRDRLQSLEEAARQAGRSVGRSVDRLERRLPGRSSARPTRQAPPPATDPEVHPETEVHPENDAPRPARP